MIHIPGLQRRREERGGAPATIGAVSLALCFVSTASIALCD